MTDSAEMVATLETAIREFSAQVHASGGVVTVFPPGHPSAGQLAARYIGPDGVARYVAAPPAVQQAREALRAQEREDMAAGAKLDLLVNAFGAAGAWLAALPRRLLEKTLGIPTWVIPAAAVSVVGILLLSLRERTRGR